jgi:response regulator RpfG family c-di-GMP phosphodiesterase
MFRILVISQDCDASELWFKEMNQIRESFKTTTEAWQTVIRDDLPDQAPEDCHIIFIDAFCGWSPSSARAQGLLDMCQHLRSITTKVIIIHSPVRNVDFAVKAYSLGADEYVFKPTSPWLLLSKLEAWEQWTSKRSLL